MDTGLAELWKNASDEEVIAAVGRWDSTNARAQQVLSAEVRRRGLGIAVPEIDSSGTGSSGRSNTSPASIAFALTTGALICLGAYFVF